MPINVTIKQPKRININTNVKFGQDIVFAYNYPPPTGQTTEFATGDDAWQYFNIWKPLFDSLKGKKVVTPVLKSFGVLQNKNEFGNYNRVTDENGGQGYNNNYAIDHYTGLAFYTNKFGNYISWFDAINSAMNLTIMGFNDFYIGNYFILVSTITDDYININADIEHLGIPLLDSSNVGFPWSSTTTARNNNDAIYSRRDQSFLTRAPKSFDNLGFMPYRIHYQPQF